MVKIENRSKTQQYLLTASLLSFTIVRKLFVEKALGDALLRILSQLTNNNRLQINGIGIITPLLLVC